MRHRLLTAHVGMILFSTSLAWGQSGAQDGEWRHYAGDRGSTRYSALDQINSESIDDLEVRWRWESADQALVDTQPGLRQGMFKVTPLMISGVLYASTSFSQVAAIDAGTGETLWVHDPKSYERGRPANSGFQHRGVEYWTDGNDERIIIATGGRQLIALNARTGRPYADFGIDGWVNLEAGLGREFEPRLLGFNSPTIVCRDTIVVGSIVTDGTRQKEMPPGHVRGYDVRTGEMQWIFHTIPQAAELGNDTWEGDSWRYSGNTNVWSTMSCDEETGYVYLPIGTPTNDYYGGHRLGNNLFAESLVALDASTGQRVWHFQGVHHGLWDYDFMASPNLVDLTVDGQAIRAVAQVSKQGFTYVFDRITGEPVWPIEERPVPASTVPGERAAPTQPFPTKPPPFERQGVTVDDLIDFTPELREAALQIASEYVLGPVFTPPSLIADGNKGTLVLPSAAGGANWGGAAVDPETGILYVPSMTQVFAIGLSAPDSSQSNLHYLRTGPGFIRGSEGLPLVKPPYGRVTAIDLNTGDHVWQVPHGDGPRDHPAIAHLDLGPLGSEANGVLSNGGPLLTKTLLFTIQAVVDLDDATRMGTGGYLRAFDKRTGALVGEKRLEGTPHGTPMTFLHEGRQLIVLAVGGRGQRAELVAFGLSE